MPARTIDFPSRSGNVSTAVAAEWLGVTAVTFLRMVGIRRDKPEMILPGIDWLRPIGKSKEGYLWDWLDVVAVRQIMKGQSVDAKEFPKNSRQSPDAT